MRAISILILVLFVGNAFAYTFPSSFLKISMKKDLKDRFYTTLHSTQVDDINTAVNENKSSSIKWNYANVLLFTPLLSPLLSVLFAEIANPMISGSERQLLVIGLLLSKRLYLYFSAFGIVDLSSQVASADFVPNIGERLKVVNEVLLPGYMSSLNASTDSMAVYESLDKVDESTAALWLPVALAVSLLGTLVVLTLSNSPPPSMPGFEIPFAATIAKSTQSIAILGNFAVCILFVKAVFKSAFVEFKFDKLLGSELLIAIVLTGLGFILPPGGPLWPIHNIVSACVCIGVARLLQLSSLSAVLLALGGLVLYDVLAVSGTQMLSDNGQSVMEAVATAKLGLSQITNAPESAAITNAVTSTLTYINAPSILDKLQSLLTGPGAFAWRPGLLEVSTGGRISDALGLGDVVFPAILAGWALRYDKSTDTVTTQEALTSDSDANALKNNNRRSLFSASLVGYFVGCILCDVFMTENGQPALLYIVPSMVASVLVTSASNKELQNIFKT